jgi:hypothetical protein
VSHFAIAHDFAGTPDAFWKIFFDETFNLELYQRIKVKERKMLDRREDEQTIYFSVKIMPERDLPGFIKKILGGDLGYTESSTYFKGKNYLDVNIEPTLMKDKTKMKAVYRLTETAPGKLTRTFEGDIDVSVPLVGGKVERTIIDDMTRSYDVAAQVMSEWLART